MSTWPSPQTPSPAPPAPPVAEPDELSAPEPEAAFELELSAASSSPHATIPSEDNAMEMCSAKRNEAILTKLPGLTRAWGGSALGARRRRPRHRLRDGRTRRITATW